MRQNKTALHCLTLTVASKLKFWCMKSDFQRFQVSSWEDVASSLPEPIKTFFFSAKRISAGKMSTVTFTYFVLVLCRCWCLNGFSPTHRFCRCHTLSDFLNCWKTPRWLWLTCWCHRMLNHCSRRPSLGPESSWVWLMCLRRSVNTNVFNVKCAFWGFFSARSTKLHWRFVIRCNWTHSMSTLADTRVQIHVHIFIFCGIVLFLVQSFSFLLFFFFFFLVGSGPGVVEKLAGSIQPAWSCQGMNDRHTSHQSCWWLSLVRKLMFLWST